MPDVEANLFCFYWSSNPMAINTFLTRFSMKMSLCKRFCSPANIFTVSLIHSLKIMDFYCSLSIVFCFFIFVEWILTSLELFSTCLFGVKRNHFIVCIQNPVTKIQLKLFLFILKEYYVTIYIK